MVEAETYFKLSQLSIRKTLDLEMNNGLIIHWQPENMIFHFYHVSAPIMFLPLSLNVPFFNVATIGVKVDK